MGNVKESTDEYKLSDRDRISKLEDKYKRVIDKMLDGKDTMDELKVDVKALTMSNIVVQQRVGLLIWILGLFAVALMAFLFTPKDVQPIEITIVQAPS